MSELSVIGMALLLLKKTGDLVTTLEQMVIAGIRLFKKDRQA